MADTPTPPTGIHESAKLSPVKPGNPIQNPITPISTR